MWAARDGGGGGGGADGGGDGGAMAAQAVTGMREAADKVERGEGGTLAKEASTEAKSRLAAP